MPPILGLGGISLLQPALIALAIGVVILIGTGAMALSARAELSGEPSASGRGRRRRRAIGLGLRLLDGRIGRWLFKLMGTDLDVTQQNLPPTSERTELVLGGAAAVLFKALPSEVRGRFPEVPDVIDALEGDAGKLRDRVEQLSQALANAAPQHARDAGTERRDAVVAELGSARDAARRRLAEAVAALENIRLDLLRLQAGVGSPDDLTADLEAAKQLGEGIDAELAAAGEVAALLSGRLSVD